MKSSRHDSWLPACSRPFRSNRRDW
jgi:hypothetical protein